MINDHITKTPVLITSAKVNPTSTKAYNSPSTFANLFNTKTTIKETNYSPKSSPPINLSAKESSSPSSSSSNSLSSTSTANNSDVIVRNTTMQDIDQIVDLQKKSFPHMYQEGSVWKEEELKNHIKIFPEGQFCVELDNKIIGSSSSLIVKMEEEYAVHTFGQITDRGRFTTHDPTGDTLYAADVSIHPEYRRLGIATLLYDVRKDLAKKMNLRRIVAGGRLFNYCEYAEKMTPQEYVQKVIQEEISDPVLSFQLQNGFKFIKILPNYIRDARSCNYATFIEWINPYYQN